jgi:hypothetical protein
MAALQGSDHLGTIIGSYASGPDGQIKVERDDGTTGLGGGFPNNMLHAFAVDIISRGNPAKKPDIALLSPNPANGRVMFQGEQPTELPWKLDCREHRNKDTDGEQVGQDGSLSKMLYAVKEIKDLSGKPFVAVERAIY